METYSFSLMLVNVNDSLPMEEVADLLYEAGCDDGTYGVCQGVHTINFDREAKSLWDAIDSAVIDIIRANVCEFCVVATVE